MFFILRYLTTIVRTRATMLMVRQRSKVQSLLKDAKTNISLKGRSFPDGEETWHLFANRLPIAKSLRLTPHVTTTVEDMGELLTATYRWTYDPFVQGCAQIAKRFQNTICRQWTSYCASPFSILLTISCKPNLREGKLVWRSRSDALGARCVFCNFPYFHVPTWEAALVTFQSASSGAHMWNRRSLVSSHCV